MGEMQDISRITQDVSRPYLSATIADNKSMLALHNISDQLLSEKIKFFSIYADIYSGKKILVL